ncbi:MAG: hypothetical protein M1822_001625 [Bathelium mastoideum]|nr:MAG: hypothetical protein M1822_001625 [Bathelium mastoideum]
MVQESPASGGEVVPEGGGGGNGPSNSSAGSSSLWANSTNGNDSSIPWSQKAQEEMANDFKQMLENEGDMTNHTVNITFPLQSEPPFEAFPGDMDTTQGKKTRRGH